MTRTLVALVLAAFLGGCFAVPTPYHPNVELDASGALPDVRKVVGDSESKRPLRVGHSTRADVEQLLREPAAKSSESSVYVYAQQFFSGWGVILPPFYPGSATDRHYVRRHRGDRMAADFGVYFLSAKLPSIEQWEQAAAHLGVRLRIMPLDLLTHGGTLPVAYEADDYNTVFEFDITREWGRPKELADVLRAQDVFAAFRCFSREWPAALWAAISFAKASDGLFQDPLGVTFRTFDEALAYALADRDAPVGKPLAPATESYPGFGSEEQSPEARERQTRAIRAAEEAWAGKERTCPTCGTVFRSVQNRGGCPRCGHVFYASHPQGGSPIDPT